MAKRALSTERPMWDWFELTYASYLVLPRALLCGMPVPWQRRFAALLDEMRDTYRGVDDNYCVTLRDKRGRFIKDPFGNYRRPPPLPYRFVHPKSSV